MFHIILNETFDIFGGSSKEALTKRWGGCRNEPTTMVHAITGMVKVEGRVSLYNVEFV